MDRSNIVKSLEYDTDFSSEVDDDFLDPDFRISDRENDELDGILAFDTDSDFNSGMMQEIKNYALRPANNAESLLENKNNNICEQFNAIINKHIAGKRINFSNRGNYNTRVHAAVISFNSKEYLRCIHKKISNFSPGAYFNTIEFVKDMFVGSFNI